MNRSKTIREYFEARDRKQVRADELVRVLGGGVTIQDVRNYLSQIKHRDMTFKNRLVTISRGWCWMYVMPQLDETQLEDEYNIEPSDDASTSDIFERVGVAKDGSIIVKDEDSKLFTLSPL